MALATALAALPLAAPAATTVTDGRGRAVPLDPAPQRIISGSLASDEVVFELLQRAVQLQRLVALSTLADDARYSNLAPVPDAVKGRFGGELEAALALRPDLVIAATINRPETLHRLDEAHVRTFVVGDFTTLDDVERNVVTLGRLLHLEKTAAALRDELRAGLERARKAATMLKAKPKVIQYMPDGTVAGAGTLFDDIVRVAGGENLAAQRGLRGWPRLDAETIATLRPDAIVALGTPADKEAVAAALAKAPGWRDVPAARDTRRIILIPSAQLGAVSHHVLGAVERLQDGLKLLPAETAKAGKR